MAEPERSLVRAASVPNSRCSGDRRSASDALFSAGGRGDEKLLTVVLPTDSRERRAGRRTGGNRWSARHRPRQQVPMMCAGRFATAGTASLGINAHSRLGDDRGLVERVARRHLY